MRKILNISKKNLKIILKNKFSWFILFLSPIFIILMMGFLFNNQNSYNINIGTFSENKTDMYYSYVENLKEDNFKVVEYASENNCLDSIKRGLIHVCIFFPNDFSLKNNRTNLVHIKIDSSKNNLKSVVNNLILNSLDDKSKFYQIDNTKALINVIDFNEISAIDQKNKIKNLKNISDNLKQNAKMIKTTMIVLKASFSSKSLNVLDIEDNAQKTKESINNYVLKLEENIATIENNLNNLSSNIENATTNITNNIKDIKTDLITTKNTINSMKYIYDLTLVIDKLKKLDTNLAKLDKSLSSLSLKIDDLTEIYSQNAQKLEEQLLIFENTNEQILSTISTIKLKDSENIVKPITVQIESVTDNSSYLNPLIPTLIVSLIFIISIILSSNLVLMEKQNRAFFRNFLSQAKSFEFTIGNFLTLSFLVFIQIFFIILVYFLLIKKEYNLNILLILALIIPIIFIFVLIGMFIGNLSHSQESNLIISFITIFIIFAFSGLLLPIEILSQKIILITSINPYLISESIIRKIILFTTSFKDIKFDLIILGIYIILFLIINIMIESFNKKQYIYKLCHKIELFIKKMGNKE